MRFLLGALSGLGLMTFLSSSLLAEETPSEFMQRWVKAYNGNDGKVMASFYEKSEEVDCLVSAGIWLRGFKEIRDMYVRDMKAVRFYDSVAEKMRHRILGEKTAVVSFVHKFKYEMRGQNQHIRTHIRTTTTLRKIDESWKIVSEHSSTIQGVERVKVIEAPAQTDQDRVEKLLEAFPIVPPNE